MVLDDPLKRLAVRSIEQDAGEQVGDFVAGRTTLVSSGATGSPKLIPFIIADEPREVIFPHFASQNPLPVHVHARFVDSNQGLAFEDFGDIGVRADVESRIEVVRQRAETEPDITTFLDLLADLDKRRKTLAIQLEQERTRQVESGVEADVLADLKALAGLWATESQTLATLRTLGHGLSIVHSRHPHSTTRRETEAGRMPNIRRVREYITIDDDVSKWSCQAP